MQNYINQLINDIRQATWNLKPPHSLWAESNADPDDEGELEDMAFVEQYIYGEKQPIGQITGIEAELLPPPEKLTEDQRSQLSGELEKLLQYFHFVLDFPEKLPAHLRYSFIRNLWTEEHVPLSFGESHIEFCDYEVENCPYPDYCTCREFEAEMKEEEEHGAVADFDFDLDDILPDLQRLEDIWNIQEEMDDDDPDSPDQS